MKADPRALLTRYFDASLYFANWMFVEVAFRYAKSAVDLASLRRYRAGQSLDIRVKGADVIVALSAEHEAFDPGDDAHGWLASVLPLRAAVAAGDERLPYWGWLLGVQQGDVPDGAREPVRPGELTALTPALEAFADIVGLDPDLEGSGDGGHIPSCGTPARGARALDWRT